MEHVNQNITVEQAALRHSEKHTKTHFELQRTVVESLNISFQAGALWQKEQDKELYDALKKTLMIIDNTFNNHSFYQLSEITANEGNNNWLLRARNAINKYNS